MISVVVNFWNNRREAMWTLHSLTKRYQREGDKIHYEVIAIDNNSSAPLSSSEVKDFGPNFRHFEFKKGSQSPAAALNYAVRDCAQGSLLLIVPDGACILSPGILVKLAAMSMSYEDPLVAAAIMHLGPERQNVSMLKGYNQQAEDALLSNTNWLYDGYELFKCVGDFADDTGGWFGTPNESGAIGIKRSAFDDLGGFDERFESPGGGLCTIDFFQRAMQQCHEYIMLLGEGTFHQFHGGVAQNAPLGNHPWQTFHDEYVRLKGGPYTRYTRRPTYFGKIPWAATALASKSANMGIDLWKDL